ncbi:hypothetical protein EB001_26445 [bacterium]|nr:hypothetical protein [bacterium]
MPAPKKSVADYIAKKIAKKAVVKVKPGPNTKGMPKSPYKMPKSNVKVKPSAIDSGPAVKIKKTTTSKAGLESRGNRPTRQEQINRARDLQWDKAEKSYDAALPAVGLRGGPNAKAQGPKGKNLRKRTIIKKQAQSKNTVKINSQQNLKKKSK